MREEMPAPALSSLFHPGPPLPSPTQSIALPGHRPIGGTHLGAAAAKVDPNVLACPQPCHGSHVALFVYLWGSLQRRRRMMSGFPPHRNLRHLSAVRCERCVWMHRLGGLSR